MKSKLIIGKDGTKKWKLPNGYLHREDGLAIVCHDGAESWYLNDVEYTEHKHKHKTRSIKLKKLLWSLN